ncbi:Os12g0225150 [Oryza sativa Japonica Group]|uniref:Os12g0225150 protein n=1 Tax=Oryza sativa subsp. japonica TaxID=39947 RepID=A0A0N7KTS0_ORYSJ|nr:hypothetical protein EE612_058495 [Oryza sativa]BAT16394.1 Os12g0225150 [Oryza sativa Japonica Group]
MMSATTVATLVVVVVGVVIVVLTVVVVLVVEMVVVMLMVATPSPSATTSTTSATSWTFLIIGTVIKLDLATYLTIERVLRVASHLIGLKWRHPPRHFHQLHALPFSLCLPYHASIQ